MSALERFEEFLSGIELDRYREKYSPIKLVELDLPKGIQALTHIYKLYWDRRDSFFNFERFYDLYSRDLSGELEQFRIKTRFSEETFYLGLPARIYRTWASLLTQIQAGYVAESVFGNGSVKMSAGLDWQGIDICINRDGREVNVQIKKETLSREVRLPHPVTRKNKQIINLEYEVPGCDPLTPTGKESQRFKRWKEKWDGKLERLDNGFIIFRPGMFGDRDMFG